MSATETMACYNYSVSALQLGDYNIAHFSLLPQANLYNLTNRIPKYQKKEKNN